uniref:uncharacterized protein LOC132670818 n=1 Tax=Panthera onca TaxID=9690 RepID=UPI002952A09C|nr:uncharacterized protein LOC132670818 [Panthera onca]
MGREGRESSPTGSHPHPHFSWRGKEEERAAGARGQRGFPDACGSSARAGPWGQSGGTWAPRGALSPRFSRSYSLVKSPAQESPPASAASPSPTHPSQKPSLELWAWAPRPHPGIWAAGVIPSGKGEGGVVVPKDNEARRAELPSVPRRWQGASRTQTPAMRSPQPSPLGFHIGLSNQFDSQKAINKPEKGGKAASPRAATVYWQMSHHYADDIDFFHFCGNRAKPISMFPSLFRSRMTMESFCPMANWAPAFKNVRTILDSRSVPKQVTGQV